MEIAEQVVNGALMCIAITGVMLVWLIIFALHFGFLYIAVKIARGDFNIVTAAICGAAATVCGCLLLFFACAILVHGFIILAHFYFIPFEVIYGATFAAVSYSIKSSFNLRPGVLARALTAVGVGACIGIVMASFSKMNHEDISFAVALYSLFEGRDVIPRVSIIVFFAFMSMCSAVIIGKENHKKQSD